MQIWFIVSLLFAILVALFAVMNSDIVTIRWFWGKYEFSQAIVILGSAAVGAITVAFLGIFRYIGAELKIRELQSKLKRIEKEKEELLNSFLSKTNSNELEAEKMVNEKLEVANEVPKIDSTIENDIS